MFRDFWQRSTMSQKSYKLASCAKRISILCTTDYLFAQRLNVKHIGATFFLDIYPAGWMAKAQHSGPRLAPNFWIVKISYADLL